MLAFHFMATLLDLTGVGWSALKLGTGLILLLGLLCLGLRFGAKAEPQSRLPSLGWGDGFAFLAVAIFAALALTLWVTTPDFVFHWGLKGNRFSIAHGVDYTYLARSWNWAINPSYPNLLPELYAGTALLAGRFDPPSLMLWSVFFLALLIGAARETLHNAEPFVRQAGIAVLAVALVAFAVRNAAGNRPPGAPRAASAPGRSPLVDSGAALPPLDAPAT